MFTSLFSFLLLVCTDVNNTTNELHYRPLTDDLFMPQTLNLLKFSRPLRSRFILNQMLMEIRRNMLKRPYISTVNTFARLMIFYPSPTHVDKVHVPLSSNPGSVTEQYTHTLQTCTRSTTQISSLCTKWPR